jgi:hypothetical protein
VNPRHELYVVPVLVAVWLQHGIRENYGSSGGVQRGGMLLVRGETARPDQTVTLEGRYSTRTDRNRRSFGHIGLVPIVLTHPLNKQEPAISD